jgi:tRNA-dihydrouridine synthase B
MRTGWSPDRRNGVAIARMAEDIGIAALAVHGRTRACRFEGEAEYSTIADITAAVDIPVLANGDIRSPRQAREVLEFTGAAGVMIGRAAQGRPWLCGQIAHYLETGRERPEPSREEQARIMLGHLDALHRFYGEYAGLRIARKHVGWYLQDTAAGDEFRRKFNRLESAADQHTLLERFLHGQDFEELAA